VRLRVNGNPKILAIPCGGSAGFEPLKPRLYPFIFSNL
jgi:hypothetical protein